MAKKTIGFRFSEETHEALKTKAAAKQTTRTKYLEDLICEAWQRRPGYEGPRQKTMFEEHELAFIDDVWAQIGQRQATLAQNGKNENQILPE